MTFASPDRLFGLLLVPVLLMAYARSQKGRRQRRADLEAEGFVATGGGAKRPGWRQKVPLVLSVIALVLLVVAIARPMATIKTPREEATVVLVIDVSNSMAATDAKPSRLGLAQMAAKDFARQQPAGVQIGVVAFGSGAVIVQTPTFSRPAVLQAIDRLTLGGGTSLAAGILTGLDAISGKTLVVNKAELAEDNSGEVNFGYYGGATIVLFSDGEDTSQTDPVTMARLASSAGVRVQTVGVGTTSGTTIKADGFSVATAMDPQTLMAVAKVANGTYHQIDDPAGLADISKTINLHFTVVTQHTEVTAIFVAVAIGLLLVSAISSVLSFGRVL